METRIIGKDLSVSAIGLGCMGFSHAYGAPIDEKETIHLLRQAVDFGYTFFDTAEVYGTPDNPHVNEELVGKALAPMRNRVVIATKFGLRFDFESGKIPIPLIREGKITHWGISEANAEYLMRANAVCPVTAVENRYSMMARQYENLFSVLETLHVGLVAFSPMANGFLTGKYGKGEHFDPKTDYRATMPQFTDEAVEQNAELLMLLHNMAEKKNATPAQISLAWMLCKKPWIVPIPGTRKEERMRENAGSADVKLSPSEIEALDDALDTINMSDVFGGSNLKE